MEAPDWDDKEGEGEGEGLVLAVEGNDVWGPEAGGEKVEDKENSDRSDPAGDHVETVNGESESWSG